MYKRAKRFNLTPIAAAAALAFSASGCSADRAEMQQAKSNTDGGSDTWNEARLWTTYALNSHLSAFDLDADVEDGVATLKGEVRTEVEKDLAAEIAEGIAGINEVDNQIRVNPNAEVAAKDGSRDERRSFGTTVSDASIAAAVKSQLLWNENTSGLQIDVDVMRGEVTLSGKADSEASKELAGRIAETTDDVRAVENRLKVDTSLAKNRSDIEADAEELGDEVETAANDAGEAVNDAWITTKVKSALLWNSNVPGSRIDVDAEDGVVTLEGKVDSEAQEELAVRIADDIKGVREVRSKLQVS